MITVKVGLANHGVTLPLHHVLKGMQVKANDWYLYTCHTLQFVAYLIAVTGLLLLLIVVNIVVLSAMI